MVALTYYALEIASYALACGARAGWLPAVPEWLVALATPGVLLLMWGLVRRHKVHVLEADADMSQKHGKAQ